MRTLILMAVPLAACSMAVDGAAASGPVSSRDFPISGFTAVDLAGSDSVQVRVGSAFAVHAEGPEQTLDRLEITRNGDTLKISHKPSFGFHWGGKGARIVVTMPAIRSARVTGSGDLSVDHVAADSFTASASGSGSLNIGALDVKTGDFSLAGSGDIKASGRATDLSMSVSGSGDIAARGVQVSHARVSVVGSGDVTATVNGTANVHIVGSGDVDLGAGAKCTISKLGSGDVTCGG